jgi:hypothetical protein
MTYCQYPKLVNIKPEFQPVTKLYQAGFAPRWAQSLENQTLTVVENSWRSRPLSLFGLRLYKGGLPTISPHGTLRVAVPFSDIIESAEDFLIPLRGEESNGIRDRLLTSNAGNYYLAFVYVRKADVIAKRFNIYGSWLRRWRIGSHPYIRVTGETLSYRRFVASKEVWYEILVPYRIEFETDPVNDQTVWDDVSLTKEPLTKEFEVTDPITASLVIKVIDADMPNMFIQ